MKIPLVAGFRDPVRRPRYLIWSGVAILALAAFVVVAFGATSTYFFCNELCHSIQDDAMNTYRAGSHNTVNCLSCHEPVNADPLTFAWYKAKAGIIGAYQLYTNTNETPLNAHSKLALNEHHMGSAQCTQCHSTNRIITPSNGIIIDHEVHEENEIHCTICHNRVAHPERDYEMINKKPKTGEISPKHADFITMTACFRCHSLTAEERDSGKTAPGTCSTCHPADFELKPANHNEEGFYPAGHAKLALAPMDHATGRPDLEVTPAESEETSEPVGGQEGEEEGGSGYSGPVSGDDIFRITRVEDVDYCTTCHVKDTFCTGCHGMEMPHPEEFKIKTHGEASKTEMDKCDLCHNATKTNFEFCNNCHHGTASKWTYDPKVKWETQHAKAVTTNGVAGCLGTCHEQKFCTDCHAKVKPIPSSHKEATWLRDKLTVTTYGGAAAAPSGKHALAATSAIDSCDICHGPGGTNAAFCKACHEMDLPHPDTFKKSHVSGRKTTALCAKCHASRELCSDCHHKGAVNGTPWQQQHAKTVAADGANPCFEKCHQDKQFCVDCHTKLKAVPASHKAGDWRRNLTLNTPAKHSEAYKKQTDSCDYCHGTGGLEAAFCKNCHKITMPHPAGFKDSHKADFQAKKLAKANCENCHNQFMCDNCHHPGAVADKPWRTFHPTIVKKSEAAADACFKCHKEIFCSACHVKL